MKNGVWVNEDGDKFWYKNGKLHRVDGPAAEWSNGKKDWYLDGKQLTEQEFNELAKVDDTKNGLAVDGNGCKKWRKDGKCHREDGPAIEWPDGSKFWYKDDKPHREDGPADEWANGDKFWYLNGVHHREDGPAKEYANGSKFWYKNGKRHREDGPAAEYVDSKAWYLNGKELTEEEFDKLTGDSAVKNGLEVDAHDNRFWYRDGLYHREDGPAVEHVNGGKAWYLDGKQCSEEEYVKRGEMKNNLSVRIPAFELVKSPDGDWKLLDNNKLNTITTTHILMYLHHRSDKGVLNKDLDSYIFKYIVDKNLFKSEPSAWPLHLYELLLGCDAYSKEHTLPEVFITKSD